MRELALFGGAVHGDSVGRLGTAAQPGLRHLHGGGDQLREEIRARPHRNHIRRLG